MLGIGMDVLFALKVVLTCSCEAVAVALDLDGMLDVLFVNVLMVLEGQASGAIDLTVRVSGITWTDLVNLEIAFGDILITFDDDDVLGEAELVSFESKS